MRLIGVGVGPGDPELVTVKAVRVLATAGRVFVPVLAAADTYEGAGSAASHASGPGTFGRAEATVRAHAAHDRIERLVFALNERTDRARRERHWDAAGERVAAWLADAGGTAAFATIGDPNVYSTFGYLAETVRALLPSVAVETVPGITAMQALAAAGGGPLVEGREELTVLPLTSGVDARLAGALAGQGTVVVYKAGRRLPEVAAAIRAAGRDGLYGEHLGLANEWVGPLPETEAARPAPYLATVIATPPRTTRGGKL